MAKNKNGRVAYILGSALTLLFNLAACAPNQGAGTTTGNPKTALIYHAASSTPLAAPATSLHYSSGAGADQFPAAAKAGMNLADVGDVSELNALPSSCRDRWCR